LGAENREDENAVQKLAYELRELDRDLLAYDNIMHKTANHGNAGKYHRFYRIDDATSSSLS
jgi:hypothetical protein